MPYIKPEHRDKVKSNLITENAGELNYIITILCNRYISSKAAQKGESYQAYNDVIGALEGAKLELYRRKVSEYEDKKIKENGDVTV